MKLCYADPPYIGQAKKHYSHDPNCAEVDHNDLLDQLVKFNGWSLSCSSSSLKQILCLPTCPDYVRIGSWVKPFASFKPGVNPAYAWEPVIFKPARFGGRAENTVRDWISEPITLRRGLSGAKPERFARWIFELLRAEPGDELIDMFPGTGAISAAWENWRIAAADRHRQMPLFIQSR